MPSIIQENSVLTNKNITVIIPAYNEETTIGRIIDDVKKYANRVIVVDDGSQDATYQIAAGRQVEVYRHIINRGLGGALATGFGVAVTGDNEVIITFDADGQHLAEDIPRLILPILTDEADVVIGSRFIAKTAMPTHRYIFNLIGNIVTYLLFGIWVSDSQSGLRAFNQKAARVLKIETSAMEVSSEIIKEIKNHRLRLKEMPIKAIYTDYSLSKGQSFFVGIKTFFKLIALKFRFR